MCITHIEPINTTGRRSCEATFEIEIFTSSTRYASSQTGFTRKLGRLLRSQKRLCVFVICAWFAIVHDGIMANSLIFAIAFSVLMCNNVSLIQCYYDECNTYADCNFYPRPRSCCGIYDYNQKLQRHCMYGSDSCLHFSCASDSDCRDLSMCCRSAMCVSKGCTGCTNDADCDTRQVCCGKKTFPLDQTVCAANCVDEVCYSNDDCARYRGECCRSGRCTSINSGQCHDKCKTDSECNSDQYCCKKAPTRWQGDTGCAESCVGMKCSTNEDCGPSNECCISNKCVDRGCWGCITNSNCSTGHYCCKKRERYELSECSADCIGKSCGTNDDCGGPGESCDSDHRCMIKSNISLAPWLIAVISVSVFLIIFGIVLAVFWYIKRKRATNAGTQAGNVTLHNTRYEGAGIRNSQPDRQLSGIANPTYQENTP